jgi:pimeloyl-ACP methyl ester carboxylesterase
MVSRASAVTPPTPWVFLRGLTRDSRHWGDFPEIFRREMPGAEIVLLDLPGNGCLYDQASPTRVDAMAAWCRAELRRRGMAPPWNIFALSLGAMVALAWALQSPAELEACVLVNTSLRPFSPFHRRLRPPAYLPILRMILGNPGARECEQIILRLTSRRSDHPAALLDIWSQWRIEQPVSRANALRQLLAAACFRAPASAPPIPMLLLASTHDRLVDVHCTRQLARAWHCKLIEHPSAGHDLPLDDGAWVAAQVRRWLQSR